MKILLFSACDDNYLHLLLDMMESLGDQLQKYDFGLLDLGLSDESKGKIQKLKPDVIFKKPKWFIDLPEYRKTVFSQACITRPFIKEVFKGYDGYMQIDADLWFLDNSAIDDYIIAADRTGFSIATVAHDNATSNRFEFRQRRKTWYRWTNKMKLYDHTFQLMKSIFGKDNALKFGTIEQTNNGIFFIHADSPVWEAWQEVMQSVNWHDKKVPKTCDQACLLHATHKYNLSRTLLSVHHNWVVNTRIFLLDKKGKKLIDSVYPHTPIKVIHLVGDAHNDAFDIKMPDGKIVKTKLTRKEFLENI